MKIGTCDGPIGALTLTSPSSCERRVNIDKIGRNIDVQPEPHKGPEQTCPAWVGTAANNKALTDALAINPKTVFREIIDVPLR